MTTRTPTKTLRLDDETLTALAKFAWSEVDGEIHGTITEQLQPKVYAKAKKAIAALDGQWVRSKQTHVFKRDPRAALASALEEGKILVARDGFFPTPPQVTRQMLRMAGLPNQEVSILEPSAGDGAIVEELYRHRYHNVTCIEKNEERRAILRSKGFCVHADTDCTEHRERYDAIIMNPPFELAQDCDHITHLFYECLNPGGILVSVVSSGVFFRQYNKEADFRVMVMEHGYDEPLAPFSFLSSGTGVSTRLVKLTKPL